MGQSVHAVDYLSRPEGYPARGVCAVYGPEAFLRREVMQALWRSVLGDDDGEFSRTIFDGNQATLSDVLDELRTVPMFGGGKRLVVVENADKAASRRRAKASSPASAEPSADADEIDDAEGEAAAEESAGGFVSRYRRELEDYAAAPVAHAVLVLDLLALPATTRLAKAVAASGLAIQCSAPEGGKLRDWLVRWARDRYRVRLDAGAAELIVELVGDEMGLLDQEVAKLSAGLPPGAVISTEHVSESVGAWRVRTAWDMLDRALDGDLPAALAQLDRLLAAGEHPVAILAQISANLRRLAAATRLALADEAAGKRIDVRAALRRSGVPPFYLDKTERQLRRLGRQRGMRMYRWLLECDEGIKGGSQLAPRLVLERLLVRLAGPREVAG